MTNEQIFEKLIDKAVKNGFDIKPFLPAIPSKNIKKDKWIKVLMAQKEKIWFNHNFAKAIWKSEDQEYTNLHCKKCDKRYVEYEKANYCKTCGGKVIEKKFSYKYEPWIWTIGELARERNRFKYHKEFI